MDFNKNYYQILGVDKITEEQDIKKAFRNLSKTHHPDKGGNSDTFKSINEANSILSDSTQRAKYDTSSPHGANYRQRTNGFSGGSNNPFNEGTQNPFNTYRTHFGVDIEDFLNKSGFRNRYYEEIEDLDIELTINITLKEIYNNTPKDFTYIRNVKCTTCEGSGEVNMVGYVECHHCNGTGRGNNDINTICSNCKGSGKITKKICNDCNGTKVKLKKETLPLSNLFILSENHRTIAYNGYGNSSKNYKDKVGRLVLQLIPTGDKNYKKVGKDLYFKTKLNFKTAILGGSLEYEHLDGKIYSVKIPEKTNNLARFKLKEKGLMITQQGNRGDLYIDIELFIDYTKLSSLDIEILKNLT